MTMRKSEYHPLCYGSKIKYFMQFRFNFENFVLTEDGPFQHDLCYDYEVHLYKMQWELMILKVIGSSAPEAPQLRWYAYGGYIVTRILK